MDGLDACPDHLRDVGAVREDEGHQPPEEQGVGQALEVQCRDPERQHEHQQDRRDAAEQVGVDHRDDPQRQQHRGARLPHQRDGQGQDQDQYLADQEELDVVGPEGMPDRGERRLGVAPVEERRLDRVPARRGDRAEHDHREERRPSRLSRPGARVAGGSGVRPAARSPERSAARPRRARSPAGHWRTGTFTVWLSHFFSIASSVPSLFMFASARFTQSTKRVVLLEQHAELLGAAALLLELADDRRPRGSPRR